VVIFLLLLAGLLAGLIAAGNAVYRQVTREVTLAEMGIEDKSSASWSYDNGSAVTYGFHVVTFSINTTNSSEEVRKARFCARKESGTDNCLHYKVGPHSTAKFQMTMDHARFGNEDKAITGPKARIVEIDGFHVRS
jgi:hypothetical protein